MWSADYGVLTTDHILRYMFIVWLKRLKIINWKMIYYSKFTVSGNPK